MGLRPTPKYPAAHENNSSDTPGSCAFVLASCVNVLCSSRNLYVVKDCVTTLKGHVQSDASTPNLLLGQQCWELLCPCWRTVVCQRMQQLATMLTHLQFVVGKMQPIRLQHCCATLRRSRNKRNVGSCWPNSLTGFKFSATTSDNMQQGVQTDARCNTQQCCVPLQGALEMIRTQLSGIMKQNNSNGT